MNFDVRRAALFVACVIAGASAAAEAILSAAPTPTLRPAHLRAVTQYPVDVNAEFVIDRVGSARDLRFDPAAPPLFADAVRSALEKPGAFWPAQGQCRFLEQDARIAFRFGAPEAGADVTLTAFEALAPRLPDAAPAPHSGAYFLRASSLDLRPRPPLEGDSADHAPPIALSKIKVRIPDELRHSTGLAGYAWLTFELTAKGRARDVAAHDVWSRVPGKERHLGIEATRALREVEFEPGLRGGVPVARRSCYLVMFTTVAWGGDRP